MFSNKCDKKNILIIGMTGVGKTTVGRQLSKRIRSNFFDSDNQIEEFSGLKITEFFSKYGEQEFRKLERRIIKKLIEENRESIISTGAGFFSDNDFNYYILSNTTTIFLDAKFQTIYERLKGNIKNRPKLFGENLEKKLKFMYTSRIENYKKARIILRVDGLSIHEIVKRIVYLLEEYES
ncbi:MAG: hypothetical protein CMN01_01500 [Rickettsiales bacterium]|nr:hypothetical protein [Rickettsiales bacterium]